MLADDLRAEPVGGGLQGSDIVHRRKRIVALAEANLLALQFLLHEGVAVEPVGGVKRKEAGHAQDDGSQYFVANLKAAMREAAALMCQDAIVGTLGGKLRDADAKGASQFHTLEDEVDAIGVLLFHAAQRGQNMVLFADAFLGPFHRELVVEGVGLHPAAVIVGAPAEDLLAHHRNAEYLAKEVDHLFGPGQAAESAMDDNAVKAVIYKDDRAAEQLGER